MYYTFSKSVLGYIHKANHMPCQDFSFDYRANDFIILSCCDGHGGEKYVRSKRGSEFASRAVFNVFQTLKKVPSTRFKDEAFLNKIKLDILVEWNRLCEADLKAHHLLKSELKSLKEDDQILLKNNPIKAYGTTLSGAMLIKDILVVVSIGDSEPILIQKGKICRVFDSNDEPVANITYSMCQEDAYQHMLIKSINFKGYDGLILGTDGLTSPYQSYTNFNENFVKPLMNRFLIKRNLLFVDRFITKLGSEIGVGDDVSIACVINASAPKKYYEK